MTSIEAQEYLRIGRSTLNMLCQQGLPFIRLKRKRLFRKADIDTFMEARIVTPQNAEGITARPEAAKKTPRKSRKRR